LRLTWTALESCEAVFDPNQSVLDLAQSIIHARQTRFQIRDADLDRCQAVEGLPLHPEHPKQDRYRETDHPLEQRQIALDPDEPVVKSSNLRGGAS
jgi:hypothetical protein